MKKLTILTIYFLVLVVAYHLLVAIGVMYLDLYPKEFSRVNLVLPLFLFLFIAFLLPRRIIKPSEFYIWILAIFIILPMNVLYIYGSNRGIYLLVSNLCFGVISLAQYSRIQSKWSIKLSKEVIYLVAYIPIFIFLGLLFFNGQYLPQSLIWDDIYSNRADIAEAYKAGLGANDINYFEYLHSLAGKVFFPFLLIVSLKLKSRVSLIIVLIISILLFAFTQHRSPLLIPCLVVFFYKLMSVKEESRVLTLVFSTVSLIFLSFIVYYLFDTNIPPDLLVRRIFFAPSALNYVYYEFFSDSAYTFWSDSKISLGLTKFPYVMSVPHMIAYEVGVPGGHANTGFLGAGFQQAGYLGMLLYSALIGILLLFLDSINRDNDKLALIISFVSPPMFWLLTSSDLPGTMLNHGLFFSYILVLVLVGSLQRQD